MRTGKIKKLLAVSLLSLLLQGCATPFSQFYYDKTGGIDITKLPNAVLPTGEPRVSRGEDPERDYLRMTEESYNLVGYSSFNGGNIDENGAITQAKKVHAAVVLLYSKYTGTVSGYTPLTLPDTRTSSTTKFSV